MNTPEATTTVTVTIDHPPSIEEVQEALDTLRAEGIPESFEVDIDVSDTREYEEGVPHEQRKRIYSFTVSARRAAKNAIEAP